MRLLLVSDTHGKMGIIDQLAKETGADAVLHAGDFGFYDSESINRLSQREVRIHIAHSDLPRPVIDNILRMGWEELRVFALEKYSFSELPTYLEENTGFRIPVYVVWGNHEDKNVVEAFREGRYSVKNLFLLDERRGFHLGKFQILGLGGNVIPGARLFDKPLAGDGGKIWCTAMEIGRLFETAMDFDRRGIRVFVTHVSPGKQPLIGLLSALLDVDFNVSGHMGTPYCSVWNEFAVREHHESENRLNSVLQVINQMWGESERALAAGEQRRLIEMFLKKLNNPPYDNIKGEPSWYRNICMVNVPDAERGYAIMTESDGQVSLQTFSTGLTFRR